MKRIVFTFGLIASLTLLLLQLSKYSLTLNFVSTEIWISVFAVFFVGLGYLVNKVFNKQQSDVIHNKIETVSVNAQKIKELGISKREYEVLQKIEIGLSNQEIAKELFISESTVKSHVSNLLSKLDARRRTQAVTKAKEANIL